MATTQTVKCYTISLCVDQYVARIFWICIFAFGPCLSKVDLILECDPTTRTDLRDTTCVMNSKQAPVGHYTLGWKTNFCGQVVFAVTRCPDCPSWTHTDTQISSRMSAFEALYFQHVPHLSSLTAQRSWQQSSKALQPSTQIETMLYQPLTIW